MRFYRPVCSSIKSVSHENTFVPNQHQNDPKMFLSYQNKDFSAHAWELATGYKSEFSAPHAHGLVYKFTEVCVCFQFAAFFIL